MPDLDVRDLAPGDEEAVAGLVMRSFRTFVGHEYADEGREEFTRYAAASALRARAEGGRHVVLVAVAGDGVAGMIEVRDGSHVSLLFVDARLHRRGVARTLLAAAVARLARSGEAPSEMSVNASRFSIPVYRRLGFEIVGPEQTVDGITFTPMRAPRLSRVGSPTPPA